MNAVCPACGVPVVPGYVRCPKCRAGLPFGGGRKKGTTVDPGGTALEDKRFPLTAVLVAVGVAVVIILIFGLRSGAKKTEAAPLPEPFEAPALSTQQPAPPPVARRLSPAPAANQQGAPTSSPDAGAAASELASALRKQRLWSTVEVAGSRLDVRSGSCGDPGMSPMIDGAKSALHSAGLTKLRCLEQSGAVVFERDL